MKVGSVLIQSKVVNTSHFLSFDYLIINFFYLSVNYNLNFNIKPLRDKM